MAYLYDVIHPSLPMLPYDEAAAARHAFIRQARAAQGRPLPFADGQIASIALTHGLTLVTANTKDFIGVEGLSLEDWLAAQ
jgi:tRNA(fMet)-specific endonuclease VapC